MPKKSFFIVTGVIYDTIPRILSMQEEHIKEESICKSEPKTTDVQNTVANEQTEDIKVMRVIRRIIRDGDNAEIRQAKDGQLSVYAVKKKREKI